MMKPKLTKPQRRILCDLICHGGSADPYDLGYPTAPILDRLKTAGFIIPGSGPAWDRWNSIISITEAGRAAVTANKEAL